MAVSLTVWLIRHPTPAIAPQTCYGQLDVGLLKPAAHCAEQLRTALPGNMLVYSSPLQRCRLLAEHLHPAPIFDARLVELHFGEWEGRRWDDIGPKALDAWAADPLGHIPPGGESARSMAARVLSFAAHLSQQARVGEVPKHIAIVAHQGPLRVLAAHWRGEPETVSAWQARSFAFGSATPLIVHF